MPTIVTLCVLAAVGAVLWWLLGDLFVAGPKRRAPKCPVCGGRHVQTLGDARRCASCGAEFRPHAAWHVHEPTLPSVIVILLAALALLGFALSDLAFGWQLMGSGQAALLALAATAALGAAVGCFLKHRKGYAAP